MLCLGRTDADGHVLIEVELVAVRVQLAYVVVSVLLSVPSPVDVHIAVVTIAVDDEGVGIGTMREAHVDGFVEDGPPFGELTVDHLHPFALSIKVA